MTSPIEDYAILGDTEAAALVSRNGSIDWLCLPRIDSPACFAALLGSPANGRWLLAPTGDRACSRRRYRDGGLVLESTWDSESGSVTVVDCMPPRDCAPDVIRLVRGESGRVDMEMELVIRFDYGSIVPWVRKVDDRLTAVGGPDGICLSTPVATRGEGMTTVARFSVAAGETVPFHLTWFPSHEPLPDRIEPLAAVANAEAWWREWSSCLAYHGPWRQAVESSLTVLKALTYAPTGGVVAAATTSLPEELGGARNWDYRFCWLRDATFTLDSLVASGHADEAVAWRDWLLRAVAGDTSALQIMYGCHGERRLLEHELDWLTGYEGSSPVRVGNAASGQFQLDVYGEVMDSLYQARRAGIAEAAPAWALQVALMDRLERIWTEPDEGIWEVRSGRKHFTHSKVQAWVAADRAVKSVERFGLPGPVERWKALRGDIHERVCQEAWDDELGSFTQSFGSKALDASALLMPLVGFLPCTDPRMVGTVEAIERNLVEDGFVHRYATDETDDGVGGGEGAFLMCSFWLADCWALLGRRDEAVELFCQLLDLRNDVGLLSEQYDPTLGRMLGNFPQAFSHVALVNTARNLSPDDDPEDRTR